MKKLIAFLMIFTVLAMGTTYGCIRYTLREPSAEDTAAEAGIDLNGFYDANDLLFTEISEGDEDVTILYPQIDGLKDSEVQAAVNEKIRSEAEQLKTKYAEQGTNIQYLSYNIYGSFANVLSVGLFSGDDAMHYEQVQLNFNLNDGSLLRLEDLFTSQADLTMLAHSAFYDALTRENLYLTYREEVSYPDENALYKTVKAYLNGEQRFAFSPSEVYLYYGDYSASLSMVEHAADIAIYSKYLGEESLFVSDDIGAEGMFTCAEIPSGYGRREFGFAAENFWYDIALREPYFSEQIPAEVQAQFAVFSDGVYQSLMDEVEVLRITAQAQPDKAYILLAEPQIYLYCASEQVGNDWKSIPSKAVEVNLNYSLYEVSAQRFEETYRQELVNLYRNGTYTMFYTGLDRVFNANEGRITKKNAVTLYNCETGTQMTLDDVFADGYDYLTAIYTQAKYDMTGYYGYTWDAAEAALAGARIELAGSNIQIYIPEWGEEQYLTMAFSQFPRSALAIFE